MARVKETSLADELAAARQHYRTAVIPAPALAVMDAELARLTREGAGRAALAPGGLAPDFILPDATGHPVRLYDLLDAGPVVLTFYRGGWCPYCNLALRGLADIAPELTEHHARLVAVSPQLPDGSLATAEANDLPFPVLSDVGNATARAFGVAHGLSEELLAIYEGFGHGLADRNGPTGATELPLPGTFVIGTDRRVRYAFVPVDYTQRAEPREVLAAVVGARVG